MSKNLVAMICLLLAACSNLFLAPAHAAQDLLIFPEIRAVRIDDNAANPSDVFATVDFFASASYGQFRLLGEVAVSENDIDAERIQLGYQFTPLTSAWLGRFHNPLGYWNTQYHHGTYLQTSVSRPEIAELDHSGGLLPSHVTGLLIETSQELSNDGALDFSFAAGTSPELRQDNMQIALHPLTLFNPGKGNHKFNFTARMAYRPDTILNNQLGVFASQAEIASSVPNIDTVNLSIAGLFAYWEKQNLKVYSSLFYIDNRVESATVKNKGSFSSGYIQLDYLFHDDWTVFGRVEDTYGENGDPYLALMNNFSPKAQVAGIRWDITHRQALKFEMSRREKTSNTSVSTVLNWSAVFP